MKQLLLIACLSFFTIGLSAQVVYVDADATGTGDGSSWADAYTDLNVALLTAPSGGSVWIADGTYTTPDTASFFIDKELTVLGGFNGSETSADAADPTTNQTILSGDVMGNDVVGVYDSVGYEDNNRVLFITDTSSVASQYTVTIDGLTIANGGLEVDQPAGAPLSFFAGAGILSFAKLDLSRVIFSANRASFGSAISLLSFTANGSVLDGVTSDGNFSGGSHQFYANSVTGLTIMNSTFDGTGSATQASGFIRFAFVEDALIENCVFSNLTSSNFGTGAYATQSDDLTYRNCTFENLGGPLGVGVFLIQGADFDNEQDEDDFVFDGCTFANNASGSDGAAIASIRTNLKIINSSVTDNSGVDGAGIYHVVNDSRDYSLNVNKSSFLRNASSGNFGGAFEVLIFGAGASTTGNINASVFEGNTVAGVVGGGCFYIQGTNTFNVTNTPFRDNVATVGSAIFTRSLAGLTMKNVTIENNGTTGSTSGAITASFDDGSAGLSIDSSTFTNNIVSSDPNFVDGGGAIQFLGGSTQMVPLNISNSTFSDNASADGASGGAIQLYSSFSLDIENSKFLNNSASGEGGAIAMQRFVSSRDTTMAGIITTNVQPATVKISNSEFYNQVAGTQGGAISSQRVGVDLTNCTFVGNTVGADGGGGGAIILNGLPSSVDMDNNLEENGGSFTQESVLIHNTFVDNFKGGSATAVGDHIAVFQPGAINAPDSNSFKITLLNNAFVLSTGGPSLEAEPDGGAVAPLLPVGNIIFESLGGNFFSGLNGLEFQVGNEDIVEDDPTDPAALFVDPEANEADFPDVDLLITDPLSDNPLIGGAVTSALVPSVDIRGNPRGDAPDIGAYEAEWGLTDTDEPVENSGLKLDFFPNPTADILNIRNEDPTILKYDVLVADQLGRILKAARFSGTNSRIDMTNLPAGVYNLRLVVNGNIYSKQVVKQ